ncbi:MAG: N-acetyl sugar amidotransferase [Gammaproteobacteria bacterium]
MSLKKCNKCGLPETYETLIIGSDGVCNICNQSLYKRESIDWAARHKMLEDLINEYRGKYDYDCIVPFSGGKDSTYTLWYLVTQLKLKPLVVQFDHGFMRDTLKNNNQRTFKKLGVDVLSFSPNWKLVKRLMLEALRRKGDFCWHCHTGIFSYPMHIALKFNVPLVFWGEPSAEYTAYYHYSDDQIEEVDEERFNKFTNLGITAEDMYGMIKGDFDLSERDLLPYSYPKLKDLKKLEYRSVCLGSFIPWNVKENFEIIRNHLGWQGEQVEGMPWDIYPYEKIECFMQGTRDYIKYLKRGYSRVTQMTALDARRGDMSLEEAGKLIDQYEGKKPPSLDLFLEYVGLTESEFNEIVKKTCVPPHAPDFNIQEVSEKTWDFEKWFREEK